MAIPDFQSLFKHLFDIASDRQEHSLKEAREKIADSFQLVDEDQSKLLPNGAQKTFDNRVSI